MFPLKLTYSLDGLYRTNKPKNWLLIKNMLYSILCQWYCSSLIKWCWRFPAEQKSVFDPLLILPIAPSTKPSNIFKKKVIARYDIAHPWSNDVDSRPPSESFYCNFLKPVTFTSNMNSMLLLLLIFKTYLSLWHSTWVSI